MSAATLTIAKPRIESLDILRGFIILLMALDHTRDFFHVDAFRFNPEDVQQSNLFLFFTRWITHLCAPLFLLLAGISIQLYQNTKTFTQTRDYLVGRGLWLIVLELTVIQVAWHFSFDVHHITGLVIWVLGWSMVFMALVIYLPTYLTLTLSIALITLHNLFDGVQWTTTQPVLKSLWAFLHVNDKVFITDEFYIRILYPLIPALAIMMLGYVVGKWYSNEFNPATRKRYLATVGILLCVLFLVFRFFNFYGDALTFEQGSNSAQTLMSFFNISKYPFSLHYCMATLGIGFLLLYLFEQTQHFFYSILSTLGKASLFFYIVHLYFFHGLAGMVYLLTVDQSTVQSLDPSAIAASGYGYPLWGVYIVWILGCIVLYYACTRYLQYKKHHQNLLTRFV